MRLEWYGELRRGGYVGTQQVLLLSEKGDTCQKSSKHEISRCSKSTHDNIWILLIPVLSGMENKFESDFVLFCKHEKVFVINTSIWLRQKRNKFEMRYIQQYNRDLYFSCFHACIGILFIFYLSSDNYFIHFIDIFNPIRKSDIQINWRY